jgi:hypothetical protein
LRVPTDVWQTTVYRDAQTTVFRCCRHADGHVALLDGNSRSAVGDQRFFHSISVPGPPVRLPRRGLLLATLWLSHSCRETCLGESPQRDSPEPLPRTCRREWSLGIEPRTQSPGGNASAMLLSCRAIPLLRGGEGRSRKKRVSENLSDSDFRVPVLPRSRSHLCRVHCRHLRTVAESVAARVRVLWQRCRRGSRALFDHIRSAFTPSASAIAVCGNVI